ncbi:MAG: hemerythrin domain-containing protein [Acidobacteriaceae bacterium]
MAVQIGAKPDSGFDNPLGMLADCHRRIERFLHILCTVAAQASGRSLNQEEADAVNAALLYFQEGGRRHNADEEESLFPRLRAAESGSHLHDLAHLEDDHRRTEQLHHQIETLYRKWIAATPLSAAEQTQLLTDTAALKRIYAAHIEMEESAIFPHAARVLDSSAIAAIGAEFQARRK